MKIMYRLRDSDIAMAVDGPMYLVIWGYRPHSDNLGQYDREKEYYTSNPLEAWTVYIQAVDMEIRRKIHRLQGGWTG